MEKKMLICAAKMQLGTVCLKEWNCPEATWSILKARHLWMFSNLIRYHMTLGTGGFPGIHMVGWGGGGVGDDNVLCTCTHGRCYATSWDGVGDDNVPCTCTHGRCYATSSFLYLHTWSLLRNIMGWGGVGDDNVPCTCTHGRCYATSSFLYLHTWSLLRNIMGWGGVGWGGGW